MRKVSEHFVCALHGPEHTIGIIHDTNLRVRIMFIPKKSILSRVKEALKYIFSPGRTELCEEFQFKDSDIRRLKACLREYTDQARSRERAKKI